MVDGSTRLGAFVRILLPLVAPGLVATSVFAFITSWNEYIFAQHAPERPGRSRRSPSGCRTSSAASRAVDWGALMAASTLIAIPVVDLLPARPAPDRVRPDRRRGERAELVMTTERPEPAARTSECGSRGTCGATWPTSPRAATPACCTRSPRTTSPTTAARWPRSSRSRTTTGLFVQASPWGLGRTFGGEAESRWVAFHPEECQVLDDGRRVAAACLNSSAYRAFCKEWADWVLECGVDSVFWDEPAWVVPAHVGVDDAARWTCRCDRCAERFGGPIPARADAGGAGVPRGVGRRLPARGGRARRRARRREHDLPAAGDRGHARHRRLGRGRGAARASTRSSTDPYWKHWDEPAGPFVRRFARLLRETADRHGVGAQLWLPSFGLTRDGDPGARGGDRRARARRASTTSGRGATRRAGT